MAENDSFSKLAAYLNSLYVPGDDGTEFTITRDNLCDLEEVVLDLGAALDDLLAVVREDQPVTFDTDGRAWTGPMDVTNEVSDVRAAMMALVRFKP